MNTQNGCSTATMVEKAAILAERSERENERILDVRFDMKVVDSQYLRPMRMHFQRRGKQFTWDMAVEHDNVAILIYHIEKKQLLLVKQFRPPVFIHNVRTRSENIGRRLDAIEWSHYPIDLGETLELCAGLMDKEGKSPLEHAQEEIKEECGYLVPNDSIKLIKRYVTGISISGAAQHLFYAQIDELMRVSEGGGNIHEGEFIKKEFLDISEISELLRRENTIGPPSMLFALSWWLFEIYPTIN